MGKSGDHGEVLAWETAVAGPVWTLAAGLGLTIAAVAIMLAADSPQWAIVGIVAVLAVACFIGSAVWWNLELAKRVWVTALPDGFLLRDRNGERTVADDQVLSMAISHRRNFSSGELKSVTRTFTVWMAADGDRVEQAKMVNRIAVGTDDPLQELIKRFGDRLLEQAHADLRDGHAVLGAGWALDQSRLTVKREGEEPLVIALGELRHVEEVDREVCCWVRGRDEPAVKIPLKTTNAYLLWQLLEERLKGQPEVESEPEAGQLGRIIFERRSPPSTAIAFYALAGLLDLVGLALIVFGIAQVAMLLVGVGLILAAVGCVVGARHSKIAFFRCHQWGVHQRGLLVDKQLRYRDVQAFTYRAVRTFVNGVYQGTSFEIVFDPIPEERSNKISYAVQLRKVDDALEMLRDQIAGIIGSRMVQQIRAGRPVPWTNNLRFLPDGLEYRPSGWIGRKEPEFIAYEEIAGYRLETGTFQLFAKGRQKPVMEEEVGEANFFPGFVVLESMASPPDDTPSEPEPADNEP